MKSKFHFNIIFLDFRNCYSESQIPRVCWQELFAFLLSGLRSVSKNKMDFQYSGRGKICQKRD